MDGRSGITKEELEGFREEGELLSLVSVPSATINAKLTPLKISSLNHSKQLALISKSILSPASKGKLPSFKKHDDDSVFMLETDSELDKPLETETENYSGWHNEVRAMEAEVNLHMLRWYLPDEENYTLSHQAYCLAMLFDYYMDEATPSEKRKTSSVIDVRLCKPVSGRLLARSFRGSKQLSSASKYVQPPAMHGLNQESLVQTLLLSPRTGLSST